MDSATPPQNKTIFVCIVTLFVSWVSIMKLCTCFSARLSSNLRETTATRSAVQPAPCERQNRGMRGRRKRNITIKFKSHQFSASSSYPPFNYFNPLLVFNNQQSHILCRTAHTQSHTPTLEVPTNKFPGIVTWYMSKNREEMGAKRTRTDDATAY